LQSSIQRRQVTNTYGFTGEISFYLPESKTNVAVNPLVYSIRQLQPETQFYFWPSYNLRKGDNAVFVQELTRNKPVGRPPPPRLSDEFESVTEIGISNVLYRGDQLLRPLQLYACRGLK